MNVQALSPFFCVYCRKKRSLSFACLPCYRKLLKNILDEKSSHPLEYIADHFCILYNKETEKLFQQIQNEANQKAILLAKRFILKFSPFSRVCHEKKIEVITSISGQARNNKIMPSGVELLALELAKALRIPFLGNVFYKSRQTEQRKLKGEERYDQNLFLNLDIRSKNAIVGKNILIFDDIYTTGTTLLQAAALSKRAGARLVSIFTLGYRALF